MILLAPGGSQRILMVTLEYAAGENLRHQAGRQSQLHHGGNCRWFSILLAEQSLEGVRDAGHGFALSS